MILEAKPCKTCGNVEEMAPSCNECLACRIRAYNNRNISSHRKYYLKNREQILEKAKKRREAELLKRKEGAQVAKVRKGRYKERAKWTVEYIKTDEGYSWRAWFRNPATDRLVKFESARVFLDILAAQQDYTKATR